eukprot:9382688-Prorocentrum_lima.AAC.1
MLRAAGNMGVLDVGFGGTCGPVNAECSGWCRFKERQTKLLQRPVTNTNRVLRHGTLSAELNSLHACEIWNRYGK